MEHRATNPQQYEAQLVPLPASVTGRTGLVTHRQAVNEMEYKDSLIIGRLEGRRRSVGAEISKLCVNAQLEKGARQAERSAAQHRRPRTVSIARPPRSNGGEAFWSLPVFLVTISMVTFEQNRDLDGNTHLSPRILLGWLRALFSAFVFGNARDQTVRMESLSMRYVRPSQPLAVGA